MPNEARVVAMLEDLAGRRQPVMVGVRTKVFVAAIPGTLGGFMFERTAETTAEGYVIFRQVDPRPRSSDVADAAAGIATRS